MKLTRRGLFAVAAAALLPKPTVDLAHVSEMALFPELPAYLTDDTAWFLLRPEPLEEFHHWRGVFGCDHS